MFPSRFTLSILALITLSFGCSTENKSANESQKSNEPIAENEGAGDQFLMGKTDFGIGPKSQFSVTKTSEGKYLLTVEIKGSKIVHENLQDDQGSEWSWIPTPPMFYLRQFPISEMPKTRGLKIKLSPADDEKYDVGMYAGEQNRVKDLVLIVSENQIQVSGNANIEMAGKHYAFRIRWTKK